MSRLVVYDLVAGVVNLAVWAFVTHWRINLGCGIAVLGIGGWQAWQDRRRV